MAAQGRDETAQSVRVKIWGEHSQAAFQQLDDDDEKEYVITSRNSGMGPYYRLQIIDFTPDGILTWSYYSFGGPFVKDVSVILGDPQPYEGAATKYSYASYQYSASGLKRVGSYQGSSAPR